MGFGSNATGDCCSKCWNELQRKNSKEDACTPVVAAALAPSTPVEKVEQPAAAKEVVTKSEPAASSTAPDGSSAPATSAAPPKKKKKKKGYKNLIAGMMESSGKDEGKEKEQLKKTVGGGQFVK